MILNTKEFKEVCKTILIAIDTSEPSTLTETLQLETVDNFLNLSVANREYNVTIKFNIDEKENFKATVKALSLLKLIAQFNSETIELNCDSTTLSIKSNGSSYKLPLIYNNSKMLELPKIEMKNVTSEFNIKSSILNSIYVYNGRELQNTPKVVSNPAKKLCYIDEAGAIVYYQGACINSFMLENPVKILLTKKSIKLLKLFKNNDSLVSFKLGHDIDDNNNAINIIRFANDTIEMTITVSGDTKLMNSFPLNAIRSRANKTYDYSVSLKKDDLLQSLSRLSLFNTDGLCSVVFGETHCTFKSKENEEDLYYENTLPEGSTYSAGLSLDMLKSVLDGCQEEYISLSFGDNVAIVISRQNIKNIIPEVKL